MLKPKGRKKTHPVLIEGAVYEALNDLRGFTGLSAVQLMTLLFEHKGFIPRNTVNNFFDDFSMNQRKFKEWKILQQQKENDDVRDKSDSD